MPQKISQQAAADFLESDDYRKLPQAKKDEIISYLKQNIQMEVGRPPDTGSKVLERREATGGIGPKPDSVVGGFATRALDSYEGAKELFSGKPADPSHPKLFRGPVGKIGLGMVQAEKKLGGQAKEQFKKGEVGRSLVSGAAMLDPLATASVADINELEDQGRHRQAIGTGAFDALMLLSSKGRGAKNPFSKRFVGLGESAENAFRANKLTAAAGGGRDAFRAVLGDLSETVKTTGQPKSVGGLIGTVDQTITRLESLFNQAIQLIRGQQIVPIDIANDLLKRANKPNLAKTAEGRVERAQLRHAALDFQRPWTVEELNLERMRRFNKRMSAKTSVERAAAMRSSVDTAIDQTIEDGTRDLICSRLNAANPGKDFFALKQKQSQLLDLKQRLERQVDSLADEQGKFQGAPWYKKIGMSMSGHTTGVTPRVHGIMQTIAGGPEKVAAGQVKKGFPGPIRKSIKSMKRATIMSMPLDAFSAELASSQKDDQQ